MTTFLYFHGNVFYFVGRSQENEILLEMFVRREQYEENSGWWNILSSNIVPQLRIPVIMRILLRSLEHHKVGCIYGSKNGGFCNYMLLI